jgi:putative phosphoserine phosphatase/1-acylglycerol-3-phosphate O-acyltransferase
MSGSAAFFDLDRTLLSGASGEVVSHALRSAGVVTRDIPGESLVYKLVSVFGENLPSMALGRQAVHAFKGRSQSAVRTAAAAAVTDLTKRLQPFALDVVREHQRHGRRVVLATTTPRDLIEPFAVAMGFDDVIATTYEVDDDGRYTGNIVGPYVWSRGKLQAVREWCDARGIRLADCHAYSDSVYDEPLLSSVGHPTAVNPDIRLALMATARRWPVTDFATPQGVLKIPVVGLELQRLALQFSRPEFFPYARFEISGIENIPSKGGALLCANHRSYFDVAAVAMVVARSGRTVRFLGKKEVFDAPVIGPIAAAMGGIRVDRGTGSDEPLQAAERALKAGDMVAIMPQGTIPRGRAFFDPELKGRWGAARLAAVTGVPVVPIGLWGTEHVWPRNSRLPNVTNVTSPPTITIKVGAPVALSRMSSEVDTSRIMSAIMSLLPSEAREHREPTDEELRRAYPANYVGDPDSEVQRRPGTD